MDCYAKYANISIDELVLDRITKALISVDVLSDVYLTSEKHQVMFIYMPKVKKAIKMINKENPPIISFNNNDCSDATFYNLPPEAATNLIRHIMHLYETTIDSRIFAITFHSGYPGKITLIGFGYDEYNKARIKGNIQRISDLDGLDASNVDSVSEIINLYNTCKSVDIHKINTFDNILYVYTFSQN